MNADTLARIMDRFDLCVADVLCVCIILRGHPTMSTRRAFYDFIRCASPAAVMRGRTPATRRWPAEIARARAQARQALETASMVA